GIIFIQKDLNVIGPGADNLTVHGGGFWTTEHMVISGLRMTGGILPVQNYGGDLTVADCTFTDNMVSAVIFNDRGGHLSVANCSFVNNHGTAVDQDDFGALTTITHCIISGNTNTVYRSSGLANGFGTMVVSHSTITANVTGGTGNAGAIFNVATLILIDR